MSRIIAATSAQDDRDHVPMIVDSNTQVPSRIAALIEGGGEDPGPVLAEMARKLEAYGAEALIMPCNTAHNYAPTIEDAVSIPFINMIGETVAVVGGLAGPVRRLGVLASPATRITGVFEQALGPKGVELIWPADDAPVLQTIRHIKSNGPDAEALAQLQQNADALVERQVDALLIGCTEFSLLTRQVRAKVPVIDTLDVLVDRALEFALGKARVAI